jgi:hypothetical protein
MHKFSPFYEYEPHGSLKVFLIIGDPNKEFSSVYDRRNDRQTMYIKLEHKKGIIAWKSNIMELTSDSQEFDITINYRE